jgi:DMSO/TMAO reductase YedYZ molybdopterin-dependent catalytic subunit
MPPIDRRRFLEGLALAGPAPVLAGCDKLADSKSFKSLLAAADRPTDAALHALDQRNGAGAGIPEADISPVFKANGSVNPQTPEYLAMVANGFADWRLRVGGMVKTPLELSLPQLRALPSRTQITATTASRAGAASASGKGVPLARVLDMAGVMEGARYVVFRCADSLAHDHTRYYESVYVSEARHPQSILAYELNDQVLDVPHGAPCACAWSASSATSRPSTWSASTWSPRWRDIGGGNGGYWEDQGYQWHGGI